MEENLQQLEATYGAPASLFERSAAARAKASGSTTEDVASAWAQSIGGAEPPAVPSSEAPPPSGGGAAAGDGERQAVPSSAPGLSGAALLGAVAEARGMPESLIERSAKARASATGGSVEAVLQEWATEEGLTEPATTNEASSPSGGDVAVGDAGGQASTPPESAPGLSGAALLGAVAEARGMPESLVERSAAARAKTAGVELDDVLAEWAAEEGIDVGGGASDASVESSSPSGGGVAVGDGGGQAVPSSGTAGSGGSLLAAVAAARKMPESLVERSAKARAKQQGGTVDDVLAEWAAEEGIDVGGGAEGFASPEVSEEDIEELSDAAASDVREPARAAIPTPVEAAVVEEPEPQKPPSSRSRYPAWLAAMLIVVPLLAVLYVVVVPNQPTCGSAGQLAVDPATGDAVGCDGAAYGEDEVSNFSAGAAVYTAACAVCHGANGGGGAGPAMAGGAVLAAFPVDACSPQIEWIALGSSDWPDATYGANATPVAGGMPGFEGQLSEAEIAQVVLYERVEFGGLDVEAAEAECGFEADDAEG